MNFKLNNDGTLSINGENFRYNFDSDEGCYRLYENDVYQKLIKHQMSQYFLLGKPIQAQLHTSDLPK